MCICVYMYTVYSPLGRETLPERPGPGADAEVFALRHVDGVAELLSISYHNIL